MHRPAWDGPIEVAGPPRPIDAVVPEAADPRPHRVDIRLVSIDADPWTGSAASSLWQSIDETIIDAASRSHWNANGLRIGQAVDPGALLSVLHPLVEHQNVLDGFFAAVGVDSAGASASRPIVMATGRQYEYPIGPPRAGTDVYMVRRLTGPAEARTLEGGQVVLTMRRLPGDEVRSTTVRITPEIQHGSLQQQVVQSDTGMRIANARDRWALPPLSIDWTAAAGDTLVIAPEPMPRHAAAHVTVDRSVRLADRMLGRRDAQQRQQYWVILLRMDRA